ncbi:hypothetical protein POM88_039155 [Heracleum sosnowskyi]|uniref:Uncharacterized protein n=1 Tax=Heracleum sosnowskyi TaxID=360622 RepID=A0AAD8HAP3_9APIA|nr:hypothetical protein POM88_039155 [Heracleum sosnowskyi]
MQSGLVRLIPTQNSYIFFSKIQKAVGIRFNSDKTTTTKKGDVMSNTFGEGYSSRSDEEGFGGTNQTLPGSHKQDNSPNSNEYDKSQGSEVKEKEQSRHQTQK